MKTTILVRENRQWSFYPNNPNQIENVRHSWLDRITADNAVKKNISESFFFDPIGKSATAVIPQPATPEELRVISLKFDENELDWFLDKPYRIKGLKEWLKNISNADAKRYALESLPMPKAEIEERAKEFDTKKETLNQKEVALRFMTSILQKDNPEISVIAKNQKDDLIINVLKLLPKAFRKVEISMPWSSSLELGRINVDNETNGDTAFGYPIFSLERRYKERKIYVLPESAGKLSAQYLNQFTVANMFYDIPGLAEDLVKESDIVKASNFYKEVGNEEFSAVYEFYKEAVEKGLSIGLIDVLNVEFNEFYKKYNNKDFQQIWELYKFLKDKPEYKGLEWDELLSRRTFNNDPSVKGIVKEDLEPVYKFSKEIGSTNESVEFYKTYKDLIAGRKLEDILNKNFYDFYKQNFSKFGAADRLLDYYICYQDPIWQRFEDAAKFNHFTLNDDEIENLYRLKKDLSNDDFADVAGTRMKNFGPDDLGGTLRLLYDVFVRYFDKLKLLQENQIVILYKFCEIVCGKSGEEFGSNDIFRLYELWKTLEPVSLSPVSLSDIFNFYRLFKHIDAIEFMPYSEIRDLYEFYIDKGRKIGSIEDLRILYKTVVKKEQNLKLTDVFNSDFFGFYKKNKNHDPNDIWKLYKFQKDVPEYQNLEWGKLSSLFDFREKLDVGKELSPDVLIKLYNSYKKLLAKYPTNKTKPQDILRYYNSCDDKEHFDLVAIVDKSLLSKKIKNIIPAWFSFQLIVVFVLLFLFNLFVVVNVWRDPKNADKPEINSEYYKKMAQEAMKHYDEELYKEAIKKNTRVAVENYLRKFSKGEHAAEAESKKNKMKRVGDLEWSDLSLTKKKWKDAITYCKNLKEDDHKDWRLPNIDELRTLIKDRETAEGGTCRVSEKGRCLDNTCWTSKTCNEACPVDFALCNNDACHDSKGECDNIADGRYSKFGDHTWMWSSSTRSDNERRAWSVIFYRGSVDTPDKSNTELYVRCVRNP